MFELHIRLALRSDITSLVTWNAALAWETEAKQLDTTVLERGVTAVFDEPRRGFYLVAEAEGVPGQRAQDQQAPFVAEQAEVLPGGAVRGKDRGFGGAAGHAKNRSRFGA